MSDELDEARTRATEAEVAAALAEKGAAYAAAALEPERQSE